MILRRVTRNSAQLWNSYSRECRATSTNREISATATIPEYPQKVGETTASRTHGAATQSPTKDRSGKRDFISDLP